MNQDEATNRPNSTPERPLTEGQRVKIWAAAREVGLTDDGLHDVLDQVVGKRSVRTLTKTEARLVIDYLVDGLGASGEGRNFVPSRRPAQHAEGPTPGPRLVPDNLVRLATHDQLQRIAYLLRDLELGWDSTRFLTVVARATGKGRIRTTRDASKVIDALTAIARRGQLDRGGEPGPAA